jgi:hypothetical protein
VAKSFKIGAYLYIENPGVFDNSWGAARIFINLMSSLKFAVVIHSERHPLVDVVFVVTRGAVLLFPLYLFLKLVGLGAVKCTTINAISLINACLNC